jgi:hypothetical protein
MDLPGCSSTGGGGGGGFSHASNRTRRSREETQHPNVDLSRGSTSVGDDPVNATRSVRVRQEEGLFDVDVPVVGDGASR